MGLRIAAFGLLLALLVEPILALRLSQHRRPLVAVLLDNSESMRTEDADGARARTALMLATDIEAWRDASDVRIAWHRFSEGLDPVTSSSLDEMT